MVSCERCWKGAIRYNREGGRGRRPQLREREDNVREEEHRQKKKRDDEYKEESKKKEIDGREKEEKQQEKKNDGKKEKRNDTVSYTHLTLPTIYSV